MTAPLAYLSGAIEHAEDGGTQWRLEMGRFLQQELGHRVYDPAADRKKDLSDEELASFRAWKLTAPERFRTVLRKIIAWDLDWIERDADYLVALWDAAAARGGGTAAEITLAHRLGKPVYLVLGMPRAAASGWILAAADEVFDDFESLAAGLRSRFR
jgi:nucleoside 2-deoxyribosyltransferase